MVECAVSHGVSHGVLFKQTALLVKVHCNESLDWFKASGLCYTIDTEFSLRLIWAILLLPCIMEILQL